MKKLIFLAIFFINIDVYAYKINKVETLNYVDDYFVAIKQVDNDYVYSLDNSKYILYDKEYKVINLDNEYYSYIIKNGFPNKTITGDNKKDYYITQIAFFILNDYLNNTEIINKESNNEIIKLAKNLALESINNEPKIKIIETNDDYLIVKLISNSITTFTYDNVTYNIDDNFKIKNNIDNINIKTKYKTTNLNYYTYNENSQKLLSSNYKEKELDKTINISINNKVFNENKKTKTKVLAGFVDKSGKFIKNIQLIIKDYEGNIIKKFKSKSKLLNLNLSTGVYTLIDQNTNQNINFTVKQDGEKCILKLGQYLNTKIPNIKNIKNNNFFIGVFILFFGIVIINYEKIW